MIEIENMKLTENRRQKKENCLKKYSYFDIQLRLVEPKRIKLLQIRLQQEEKV